MKVLFVCTTGGSGRRQLGGAERFLVEMLPALAAAGVEVAACTPDDEVGALLRAAGVAWTEAAAAQRVDPGYVRRIREVVRTVQPDVVSAHLLSAAMHARTALSVGLRGVPLVVALHNSLWQYRDTAESLGRRASVQLNITLDLLQRRVRPHATVAVSEFEATDLRERGGVTKNVHVIPNPLPAGWQPVDRVTAPGERGPVTVGFLGRIEYEKGADLLAGVARSLPGVMFKVAGAGTVPVGDVSNVELVGRVDAAKFLGTVDCLLVPSRVESFGRSAIEALASGVPVVHSGVGGLDEVTRRAGGLAVRADLTVSALAAAIRGVLEAPASPADRLAVAQAYTEEYAFARCADRWRRLYATVAGDAR